MDKSTVISRPTSRKSHSHSYSRKLESIQGDRNFKEFEAPVLCMNGNCIPTHPGEYYYRLTEYECE